MQLAVLSRGLSERVLPFPRFMLMLRFPLYLHARLHHFHFGVLLGDRRFVAGAEDVRETKTKEWEERSQICADELVAWADTVKIPFKKTLPDVSASFVQLRANRSAVRRFALSLFRVIQRAAFRGQPTRMDLLVLALRGGKAASK